jgi:hypothetical protein
MFNPSSPFKRYSEDMPANEREKTGKKENNNNFASFRVRLQG